MFSSFLLGILYAGVLWSGEGSLLPHPDTVKDLDLESYKGLWFEMYNNALSAYTFERHCECTTALVRGFQSVTRLDLRKSIIAFLTDFET
jgi:lipocalin